MAINGCADAHAQTGSRAPVSWAGTELRNGHIYGKVRARMQDIEWRRRTRGILDTLFLYLKRTGVEDINVGPNINVPRSAP